MACNINRTQVWAVAVQAFLTLGASALFVYAMADTYSSLEYGGKVVIAKLVLLGCGLFMVITHFFWKLYMILKESRK